MGCPRPGPSGCRGSSMAGQGPFWLQLGPCRLHSGLFWSLLAPYVSGLHFATPFKSLQVLPLELSLQPQPHFHSLASPQISVFWVPFGSHFVSSGFFIPPIGPFLGVFGFHLQLILRPLAF